MIDSVYISSILISLIEGEAETDLLNSQIKYLTIEEYNYTGVGLFVKFSKESYVESYRIGRDCVLDGLQINSRELDLGADAILFIQNGLIDYLEICSKKGDYPNHELRNYELVRTWK